MLRRAFSRIESRSIFTPIPFFCVLCRCQPGAPVPAIEQVVIGDGIRLHYVEQGSGTPLVLVHGSLSDGGYWTDQIGPWSEHYHVIAYSRRYNYPNENPTRAGYSAITDADDLASLIGTLRLGKVVVLWAFLRCSRCLVPGSAASPTRPGNDSRRTACHISFDPFNRSRSETRDGLIS